MRYWDDPPKCKRQSQRWGPEDWIPFLILVTGFAGCYAVLTLAIFVWVPK